MSKKSKSRTGGKGKLPGKVKNGLPTCDRVVENPERKWRLALAPKETITVAQNAPLLQMVIQNVGPAVFEVTVEDRDPVILMPGKLSVLSAYGRITIETPRTCRVSPKWSSCRGANRNEAAIYRYKG